MFTGPSPIALLSLLIYALYIEYTRLYQDNYLPSSYWNEKGIGRGRESGATDLNSTALGFRTLRLHGYTVSSGIYPSFIN